MPDSRRLQILLGMIFLVLGAWALFFPSTVEHIGLQPQHIIDTAASAVLIACFGAQAMLCGTVIVMSRFTAKTFLMFGLVGSIPFFVFNYYFVFIEPIFTDWMLLDFAGNVGILACGIVGWRMKLREDRQAGKG